MSNYEVISKEPVSNVEVLDVILKKEKDLVEDAELTYREDKVRVFLKDTVKLSIKELVSIKEDLLALELPMLGDDSIIKLIDLMPKNGTELRAIVSHGGTVIVDENVEKVLSVLNKYRK